MKVKRPSASLAALSDAEVSRALALMVIRAGGLVSIPDEPAAVAYSFQRGDGGLFVLRAKRHGAQG
jgi:hypothetical protein